MPELEGKVALVTGGSYGIGAGIAFVLAREGAQVAVNHLGPDEEARRVVDKLTALGRRAVAIRTDVAGANEVRLMVEEVRNSLGDVDVLVNNAGIMVPMAFHESSEHDWDRVIAVNLKGMLNCCKAVVPRMMARQKGKIINISSVAGRLGVAENAVYSMTKGGIISFTKALARELAPYKINVNAVLPGPIEGTHQTENFPKELMAKVLSTVPLGRMGTPDEIGEMVSFLASERSKYATGHCFIIDGGRSI